MAGYITGKVTAETTNLATMGMATYGSITDFVNFDNVYRGWGVDGTDETDAAIQGPCTASAWRIWDTCIFTDGSGANPVTGVTMYSFQ